MVIQSHGSENVNAMPARTCRRNGSGGGGSRRGGRASDSATKLTKNVAASIANALGAPAVATMIPPTTGPATRAIWNDSPLSAFPDCRTSSGMSSGMMAVIAGWKNAALIPKNADAR